MSRIKFNTGIEYEDIEEPEEWEGDAYYWYKEDWQGLMKLRLQRVEKHPESIYDQWALGEAYALNGEYKKAINLLNGLHKKTPDDLNIQHSILQALLESGQDETAVDWIIKPEVLKLDAVTLDFLYDYLRTKRKPRSVDELYLECYNKGYPMFDVKQLMLLLCSDDRFIVTGSEEWIHDCSVVVNRKNKTRKNNL